MKSRRELSEAVSVLGKAHVIDVQATFEMLRNDLAETVADLAAETLLHREECREALDALSDEVYDEEITASVAERLSPPLWDLLVEDFQRLAAWLPRQRLARFGESDAVLLFRERVLHALRPALVELERYGVLSPEASLLAEDYWDAESLYDLALRYEAFTLSLTRAIQTRFRKDRQELAALQDTEPDR